MKNILIIDDDEGPLSALSEALESDFQVHVAQTLKAAQMVIEDPDLDVDLILTDYHLGKSGTASDLIHFVRTSSLLKNRNLPIIVMSADSSQRFSVETQNVTFLEKPFKIMKILELINSLLN